VNARALERHPDRLLPADPAVRAIARRLYSEVDGAPIVSPHGHVDPRILLSDEHFPDPATLFVAPDHYVTRMLHASGMPLDRIHAAEPRELWRAFCSRWRLFDGTPSGYWIADALSGVFGIGVEPSVASADELFDELSARLSEPEARPRALFSRFTIEFLATTDDPLDDLEGHVALQGVLSGTVAPTFRPDAYLDPVRPDWAASIERLAAWAGTAASDADALLDALAARRRFFRDRGAVSTDHGPLEPIAVRLDSAERARLHARCLAGTADTREQLAYAAGLLYEMARMSSEDGLVMTIHPGIVRDHHAPTRARFGPDTGHDIPRPTSFVEGLRPVLNDFGVDETFRLVLFTVDETTFSRELAPLAGFYPTVFIGAPWWFLDAPDAMRRFREATMETTGFSRYSGFVDDTRAFCSIPARHDAARRIDAGVLARLVAEHRMREDDARDVLVDSVGAQPRRVFRIP